jgi:UDPglucose 6-dehydrogenase
MSTNKLTIGYAGMTHLGINYAVAGAGKGFNLIGYDPNSSTIKNLAAGKTPVVEPGLDEALAQRAKNMQFTDQIKDLAACEVVYIAPDVSTNDSGQSDLTYIRQLISDVIPVLSPKAVLVVLAQVPPGFTRSLNLEPSRLYYQVETLVFGQALARAEQPERLMIGCADPSQAIAPALHAYLESFACPILPMRYESAELCKIAINCCLVASVTVANSLGELCENIGADWSEIVPALKLDKRIGPHAYLQPGLGLSGGNLERDLATVVNLACEYGTDKAVIESFIGSSNHRRNWPVKALFEHVLGKNPQAKIAMWGLTYKENTHSLKNSPAIKLVSDLSGFTVHAYDPVIKNLENTPNVKIAASALDAAKDADVLIIMTPWAEFKESDTAKLLQTMRTKLIIDPLKVLAGKLKDAQLNYVTLGKT